MQLAVRLHDALDTETVLQRLLPVLAGARGERRVAFARYDAESGTLVRRWSTREGSGEVESAPLALEPERLHVLLEDDTGGARPFRPADSAPAWALRDLLPAVEPERYWVRVRAVAHDGLWLGVLVVAEPRRWMFARRGEESVDAGADVLELCLARAESLRAREEAAESRRVSLSTLTADRLRDSERAAGDARAALEATEARLEALERAAASATEMLMEAHVELDRRSTRHQRQTRVLFLLRKLLEKSALGMPPDELAGEIVRTVSEAFGGGRCSLLLIDAGAEDGALRLAAAVGLPPEVLSAGVRIPLGSGVSGQVASSRTAVVVRDPEEGESHPLVRDPWYTGPAFASLPLSCRGQLLGVLNLANFRTGTVDDFEVEQLRLVALCVGLLVDHAGLNQRLFAGRAA
ncbi:MAG TPA: GAF domain-containing protein [Longimicrobiaceae bacterium]|nr:GAF domain-containing protein [Longimicrobiaceae bacterium]